MILKKLTIHNFKSLRNVTFEPGPLSVLVGTNASGKTNFARAVQFLAEVYGLGLEVAISRAGGYENISYRRQKRTAAVIRFEVEIEGHLDKITGNHRFDPRSPITPAKLVKVQHRFSINATGAGIKAKFKILDEIIAVKEVDSGGEPLVFEARRGNHGKVTLKPNKDSQWYEQQGYYVSLLTDEDSSYNLKERSISEQILMIENYLFRELIGINWFTFFSQFRVYQLSPVSARESGIPTPNASLSPKGKNLPALVDWLQSSYHEEWEIVMAGMRDVFPGLEEISVYYQPTKTLGLSFREEGVGRPWVAEDVSDGTILALSLLVASVDPRSSLIFFDELENSLHPWVLRTIVERLRQVSATKRVVITTHSPILVDLLRPEEIWIVYRKEGTSHIERLIDIEPSITESWKDGAYKLSDFLDSGSIGQAVPGGVF